VAAAIAGVSPAVLIRRYFDSSQFPFAIETSFSVLAVGKAAPQMARALVDRGIRVRAGLIIGTETEDPPAGFRSMVGSHPVPDDRSVEAAQAALELAAASSSTSPLIVLLSGGTSALMALPVPPLSLSDKQAVSRRLLAANVPIHALNAVRKHLSSIKGGQLAAAAPGPVLTLALSDVVDDDPSVIGSGPTIADTSTFADALQVIDRTGSRSQFPAAAIAHLERGARGELSETPKPGDSRLRTSSFALVGSRRDGMAAAAREAAARGYEPLIVDEPIVGEARVAAARYARQLTSVFVARSRPTCVISSGETTVSVRGNGRGGRNQEFALALLKPCFEAPPGALAVASVGTDGVDGPTDAAGAIVTADTVIRASARGLEPLEYLEQNDAYTFFDAVDGLVRTGPTGTNVGDLQVALARPDLPAEES
jgi:hydroxypyruvate reductase